MDLIIPDRSESGGVNFNGPLSIREDENSQYFYFNSDLDDYIRNSNVEMLVHIIFLNSKHFLVMAAIIAMSNVQSRNQVKQDNINALRNNDVYQHNAVQKPYAKQAVSPLQYDVYVQVSKLLHKYGFVQEYAEYAELKNEDGVVRYKNYLENYPDVLAYCLTNPVLQLCLFMFKYTVLDTDLGSLFVLVTLVSLSDANNALNVFNGHTGHLSDTVEGILTEYYYNLYEKTGGIPAQKQKQIPLITAIFVHCYAELIHNLHNMITHCLQQNFYFDGVNVMPVARADLSYESLVAQIETVVNSASQLQLRFL